MEGVNHENNKSFDILNKDGFFNPKIEYTDGEGVYDPIALQYFLPLVE